MGQKGFRNATALTMAALFGLSAVAAAQKPGKQKPRQVPQTGVETTAPATPAEALGEAQLEQMTSRSSAGLVERFHPDGTVSMDLQGRFMSVMVAGRTADGGEAVACQTGQAALDAVASQSVGPKAPRNAAPAPATTAARELK